jgi:hypothetical protein
MVHIDDDDGMGLYIVNISSLPPSTLLSIADGTCVDKCLIAMNFLIHMNYNK